MTGFAVNRRRSFIEGVHWAEQNGISCLCEFIDRGYWMMPRMGPRQ
jgi:hypothetical protein